MITSTPRRSRRFVLCGAIALSGLGLTAFTVTGAAHAAPATPAAAVRTATDDTATDDTATDDTAIDDTGMGEGTDSWWNDAEWVSESNSEQDDLAAYLDAHGVAYTVEQDGDYHWVITDPEDQAANDAIDDYYWALYPTPQADIDAGNAETDALAAFLQARGIAVTVTTDRHGVRDAEWNYDDPAAQAAVDDYSWQTDPLSAEDIAAINAEAEAEVAYLIANGFEASIDTDQHGIESAVFDESNDAIWTALDDYWSTDTSADAAVG